MSFYKMREYDDLGQDNIVARAGTINIFGQHNGSGLIIPAINYHNFIVGHSEMNISRKFIMQRELIEHLKNKKYMADAVRGILGNEIDAKQKTMKTFV